MATKYDVRIAAKHDTASNWQNIEDIFVPMDGEIIVYHDADSVYDKNGNISTDAKILRLKIGNGTNTLRDLDFVYVGLENLVLKHVQNVELHLTVSQRKKIDQSVVAYTLINADGSGERETYTAVFSTDLLPGT